MSARRAHANRVSVKCNDWSQCRGSPHTVAPNRPASYSSEQAITVQNCTSFLMKVIAIGAISSDAVCGRRCPRLSSLCVPPGRRARQDSAPQCRHPSCRDELLHRVSYRHAGSWLYLSCKLLRIGGACPNPVRCISFPHLRFVRSWHLVGNRRAATICPLLDQSEQRWIFARDGSSANDPKRI